MSIEEEKFIREAAAGDSRSFGHLVTKYQQHAFNLAFRIICDEDDARDVVQDSFIKIWKNMKRYNPKIKFSTWMYTIITNTAIDQLRSSKKRKILDIDNLEGKLQSTSDGPEKQLDNKELMQLISTATETLSEKQKLVYVLRELQGLSSEEAGEILNLTASSIKSNLYFARKEIKEKLQKIFMFERRTI